MNVRSVTGPLGRQAAHAVQPASCVSSQLAGPTSQDTPQVAGAPMSEQDRRAGHVSLEHPELCARCHRPLLVERGRRELCQSELCRERRADLLHDQSRGWDDIAEDDDR